MINCLSQLDSFFSAMDFDLFASCNCCLTNSLPLLYLFILLLTGKNKRKDNPIHGNFRHLHEKENLPGPFKNGSIKFESAGCNKKSTRMHEEVFLSIPVCFPQKK